MFTESDRSFYRKQLLRHGVFSEGSVDELVKIAEDFTDKITLNPDHDDCVDVVASMIAMSAQGIPENEIKTVFTNINIFLEKK